MDVNESSEFLRNDHLHVNKTKIGMSHHINNIIFMV